MFLNDGKTERVILAHQSGFEASQEAITEYRVLGPMINGCSWLELRPLTSRKHQVQCYLVLSLSLSLSNVEEAILSCLLKDFTWLESRFSFPWYLDSQFIHGDFFSALKFSRTL